MESHKKVRNPLNRYDQLISFRIHDANPIREMAEILKECRGYVKFRFFPEMIVVEEVDRSGIVEMRYEMYKKNFEYRYSVVDAEGKVVPYYEHCVPASTFHESIKDGGKKIVFEVYLQIRRSDMANRGLKVSNSVSEGASARGSIIDVPTSQVQSSRMDIGFIEQYSKYYKNVEPTAKFTGESLSEVLKTGKTNRCNKIKFIWNTRKRTLCCFGYMDANNKQKSIIYHDTEAEYEDDDDSAAESEDENDLITFLYKKENIQWMAKMPNLHPKCLIQFYLSETEEEAPMLFRIRMGSYGWATFAFLVVD